MLTDSKTKFFSFVKVHFDYEHDNIAAPNDSYIQAQNAATHGLVIATHA